MNKLKLTLVFALLAVSAGGQQSVNRANGVNAQSGTSYTILDGDRGKLVSIGNASAVAVALPQANSSTFISGWYCDLQNTGAGTVTITPTTSTIDGAATLTLTTNQGARIFSNGTNYFTQRGVGGTGGSGATTNQNIRRIGYHFDGNGSALTTTQTGCSYIPFTGTITGWVVDGDQSGNATFGVRRVALGSYTGTAGFSGYTDVTGGGTAPSVTGGAQASSSTLTSWVTSVTAGEYCLQLTSPATFTSVNVTLTVAAN